MHSRGPHHLCIDKLLPLIPNIRVIFDKRKIFENIATKRISVKGCVLLIDPRIKREVRYEAAHPLELSEYCAAACAIAGGATISAAADFTMKIGFVTINDQNQQWANWYKEAVEKGSNGRIEVQIYPASQLGPVPRQIEGIQLGTIEAVLLPADFFVGLDPRYGVFSVPGLFKDMKNAAAAVADPELNKEILALGESKGMVGITAFVYSAADYFAKDPIRKLDDFKGKKFRINATPAERERMRVLGATAVPLPTNEVVPALQRGAIDGTQSAIALFVNFKYIDLGKVLTQTDDTMLVPIAVVSKAWLDKLPPDLQKLVVDEGRKIAGQGAGAFVRGGR